MAAVECYQDLKLIGKHLCRATIRCVSEWRRAEIKHRDDSQGRTSKYEHCTEMLLVILNVSVFLPNIHAACVILQYEHHLLLQSLQGAEQGRLDLTVMVLMVNLSSLHREDILIMDLVEFQWSLYVTLFGLISVFFCRHTQAHKHSTENDHRI